MPRQPTPQLPPDAAVAAEFMLSFIQSLLKTGYYKPGHPMTNKARTGLFISLKRVLEGHREITFISALERQKKDVMIDGIFEEPTRLSKLLLRGMGEAFIPKFLNYFDRKQLTSFSMKSQIAEDEFMSFINVMSEHFGDESSGMRRGRLVSELTVNNIIHVSVVFNADLVGKGRELSWRVELSLTRLKNDLSTVPLYKNRTAEQVATVKDMIYSDIIRPMRTPELIEEFLFNLDLILFDTTGTSREEMEKAVTEYLDTRLLRLATPDLLKDYLDLKERYEKTEVARFAIHLNAVTTILGRTARKLAREGLADEALLFDFVKHQLIDVTELPERSRERYRRVEAMERFLLNPQQYYRIVEDSPFATDTDYMLIDFIPELLTQSRYDEIGKIIKLVTEKPDVTFDRLGQGFLDDLYLAVDAKIEPADRAHQLKILGILGALGEPSYPIFSDLITHPNRLIRKMSCQILTEHGARAVPHLVKMAYQVENQYFTRNLLMILGDIGLDSKAVENVFKKALQHEETIVREEAVRGIALTKGRSADATLLACLKDPSPGVRAKAAWGLRKNRCAKPEMFLYMMEVFQGKIIEERPVIEHLVFFLIENGAKLTKTEALEDTLIKMFKRGKFTGKRTWQSVLGDKLSAQACEALGIIGSRKALGVLKKLEQDDSKLVSEAARKAKDSIRLKGKKSS
ncbi:HEAT repeat domain-containing protein [Acidobacteriota bacterium]